MAPAIVDHILTSTLCMSVCVCVAHIHVHYMYMSSDLLVCVCVCLCVWLCVGQGKACDYHPYTYTCIYGTGMRYPYIGSTRNLIIYSKRCNIASKI